MLFTLLRRIVLGMALVMPAWAAQTYGFAIVPQYAPVEIGKRWTPLLSRLEADTGLGFQLRIHDKTPAFEADFLRGVPDFVYLNPYHMIMAAKAQGYVPLVRGAEPLAGILVADKAGPVRKLADLDGARLAFPSPNAFGASLYMRALLAEREGIDFTPVYVGTHRNVYRHVLLGEAAAGGGIEATLDREPASARERLHVLYRTPATASHPVAVHPRVPREGRDRVARALVALNREPADRKLLDDVELGGATQADFARDYQALTKLKLDRYLVVDQP